MKKDQVELFFDIIAYFNLETLKTTCYTEEEFWEIEFSSDYMVSIYLEEKTAFIIFKIVDNLPLTVVYNSHKATDTVFKLMSLELDDKFKHCMMSMAVDFSKETC